MKLKRIIIVLLMLAGVAGDSYAQDTTAVLSLDSAIAIGLRNNYNVLIARNNAQIAKNNYSLGNAGFLPQVNLTAADNLSNSNTKQKYANGLEVNKTGASSSSLSAGAALNWTLFDGLKMFATYGKLQQLQAKGDIDLKRTMETAVASIMNAYYSVVKEKQLLKVISDAMSVYQEKVAIAKEKYDIGAASKLDYLQSQVDYNAEHSAFLQQQIVVNNAKVVLNQLLARPVETSFEVSDSITISYRPTYAQLKSSVMKQNRDLQSAQASIDVDQFGLKEIRSQELPKVGLGVDYNFAKSESQASFVLQNQNLGLTAGLSASWNIFNGFNTRREYQNAEISLLNDKLTFSNVQSQVASNLLQAFKQYQGDLNILQLEEDNIKVAKENLDVAMARFKLGTSSELESKEAQNSYEAAEDRLVNARYAAKISELQLMKLNGVLIAQKSH